MCVGPSCPEDLIADDYGWAADCMAIPPSGDGADFCSDYYQRGAIGGRGDPLPDSYCRFSSTTQTCSPDYDRKCEPLPPATTYPALEPSYDCDGNEITECADWTGDGMAMESDAADACNALCIGSSSGGKKCGWSAGSTCYVNMEEDCHVTSQPQCDSSK